MDKRFHYSGPESLPNVDGKEEKVIETEVIEVIETETEIEIETGTEDDDLHHQREERDRGLIQEKRKKIDPATEIKTKTEEIEIEIEIEVEIETEIEKTENPSERHHKREKIGEKNPETMEKVTERGSQGLASGPTRLRGTRREENVLAVILPQRKKRHSQYHQSDKTTTVKIVEALLQRQPVTMIIEPLHVATRLPTNAHQIPVATMIS